MTFTPACAQQPNVQWQSINQTISNMQQQLNQIQAMVNHGLPLTPGTGGQFLLQGGSGPLFFTLSGDLNCSTTAFGNCTDVHFTLTSNASAGSNKITSLAAGTVAGDALSYGQTAAQIQGLTSVTGQSASATISNYSVNGVFNVKDPKYGAKGDGTTDDTAAVQAAIVAAQAAAFSTSPVVSPTVYFPFGVYKVGCAGVPITITGPNAITLQGAGPTASKISACGTLPALFFEPNNYLSSNAPNLFTSPLVGATGQSVNWPLGVSGDYYFNFKDLNQGNGANAYFESAALIDNRAEFTVEMFFEFPNTLTNGHIYTIMDSAGNDGISSGTFTNIHMTAGATNTLTGNITLSDGAHTIAASLAGLTANVVHSLELNFDQASNTVNFFLDGTKVNTSSATAGGATTTFLKSEQWLLGESNLGVWSENTGGANSNHWVGQIFSVRMSNSARHTANFTAPVAAFTSDANTVLLMNNTTTSDVWAKLDTLVGAGLAAFPVHVEGLAAGNNGSTVRDLNVGGGLASYGILNIGTLYFNLDNVEVGGTEAGIRYENNAYGGQWNHVNPTSKSFGEAAIELIHNSGHTAIDGMNVKSLGAYGGILADANLTVVNSLMQPGANGTVAGWSIYGDISPDKYVFINSAVDNEANSSMACYQISGVGSFTDIGGDCQTTNDSPAVQWKPGTPAPAAAGPTFIGTGMECTGTTPDFLNFNGTAAPGTTATLVGVVVNGASFDSSTIAPCSNMTKCSVMGTSWYPPQSTFANLGTPPNGAERYCSDCKGVPDGVTAGAACVNSGNGGYARRIGGAWLCN